MKPMFLTERVKQDILKEWILFCQDENTFRKKDDKLYIETVDDAKKFIKYLLEKEKPSIELQAFYWSARLIMEDFHPEHELEMCSYGLEVPRDKCPNCHSNDISGSYFERSGEEAWQPIVCNDCGHEWNEIYVFEKNEDSGEDYVL